MMHRPAHLMPPTEPPSRWGGEERSRHEVPGHASTRPAGGESPGGWTLWLLRRWWRSALALALLIVVACTADTGGDEATGVSRSGITPPQMVYCQINATTCTLCSVTTCANNEGTVVASCPDAGTAAGGADAGSAEGGAGSGVPSAVCPTPASDAASGFAFPADLSSSASNAGPYGSILGQFAVSSTGAATYHMTLDVAPGRMGMQPALSIDFDSNAGLGLLGKGVELSGFTSMVHRCGSTIALDGYARAVRYDGRDHFCLDGRRLVPVGAASSWSNEPSSSNNGSSGVPIMGTGTVVEYRTLPDSFVKVLGYTLSSAPSQGPAAFVAYDKAGQVTTYETLTMAENATVVASWLRTMVRDPRGNAMGFQYGSTTDASGNTTEYWPQQVSYTSSVDHPADRSVTFGYYTPANAPTLLFHQGMEAGAFRTQSHLLQSVTMNGPTGPVRTYAFQYWQALPPAGTGWPLLHSVQECGGNPQVCTQPTTFGWASHPTPAANAKLWGTGIGQVSNVSASNVVDPSDENTVGNPTPAQTQVGQLLTLDVTGDGLDDLVTFSLDATTYLSTWVTIYPNIGGDYSTEAMQQFNLVFPSGFDPRNVDPAQISGGFAWKPHPIDYDQDGLMDIVLDSKPQLAWSTGTMKYLHAKCVGGGRPPCAQATFEFLDTNVPVSPGPPAIQNHLVADINGDGVADLIQCNDPYAEYVLGGGGNTWQADNPQWQVFLWSRTANGGAAPGWQTTPSVGPVPTAAGCFYTGEFLAADTDGDGRTELLVSDYGDQTPGLPFNDRYGTHFAAYQLSGAPTVLGNPPTLEKQDTNLLVQNSTVLPPLFMDVNGDGHPDAVFPYAWGNGRSWSGGAAADSVALEQVAAPPWPCKLCQWPSDGGTFDSVYAWLGSGDLMRFQTEYWYGQSIFSNNSLLLGYNQPGTQYAYAASSSNPNNGLWMTKYFQLAQPIDFNGDGQQDLLIPVNGACDNGASQNPCWDVWVMPSSGLGGPFPPASYAGAGRQVVHTYVPLQSTNSLTMGRNYAPFLPHVTDVDGDGREDIVWLQQLTTSSFGTAPHLMLYKFDTPPDQLTTIWDGNFIGSVNVPSPPTVSISYGSLIDSTHFTAPASGQPADPLVDYFYNPRSNPAHSCTYPSHCVVGTTRVVSAYSIADGQGGARTYAMRYRDGRSDDQGGGWLGFDEVDTLDVTNERQGHHGHAEFFDNTTTLPVAGAVGYVYPFAGQVQSTLDWDPGAQTANVSSNDPSQVEAKRTSNTFATHADDTGYSYFTYVQSTESTSLEGHFSSPSYGYASNVATFGFGTSTAISPVSSPNPPITLQQYYPSGYYAFVTGGSMQTLRDQSTWVTNLDPNNVDPFGNVLSSTTVTSNVDLTSTTTNTYYNNPSTWTIGRLTSTTQCDQTTTIPQKQCRGGSVTSFTKYYEPQDMTRGDTGPSADAHTQLSIHLDRDADGHVIDTVATDQYGNWRSTCTAYEATGIFPYSTANSLGQATRYEYDLGLGVLKQSEDPNHLISKSAYDGLGRVLATQDPVGLTVTLATSRAQVTPLGVASTTSPFYTVVTTTTTSATGTLAGAPTTKVYDGSGRLTHAESPGPLVTTCGVTGCITCTGSGCTGIPVFAQDSVYDTLGRLSQKTLPYLKSDGQSYAQWDSYTYDAVGRVIGTWTPANTVLSTYSGNSVTVADTLGGISFSTVDGLGRASAVIDANGGMLSYAYGPFSALWSISNATDGTTKSVVRDALGRVTSSSDPDRGLTTFVYDGFGDVSTVTDAVRTVSMTYDALGRLNTRVDPDGTTTLQWDTAPVHAPAPNQPSMALGQLYSVTSPGGSRVYAYDSLIRPYAVALEVGSDVITTSVTYDPVTGRPQSTSYPFPQTVAQGQTTLVVANIYDTWGNLIGLRDQSSGAIYWSLNQLDQHGAPAIETFLGGAQRVTKYDPTTRHVARLQTGLAGSSYFQDLAYTYDPRLNVTSRSDNLQNNLTEHFYYDALDRLTCSYVDHTTATTNAPTCTWSTSYSPNGNISAKSDVGAYTYGDPLHAHAVTAAGSNTYQYDGVGNQTLRPDSTIAYTSFDLPKTYTRHGQAYTVLYDGLQQRIRKTDPSDTRTELTYFDDLYERVRSTANPSPRNDQHVFRVQTGSAKLELTRQYGVADTIQYVFPDALGSPDVVEPAGSATVTHHSYDAFGQPRNPVAWTAGGTGAGTGGTLDDFTGQEREAELPLVNMKGRIYDPLLGRFLQTDPLEGSALSSQRHNAYTYVLNNPLKFTDPTGMTAEDPLLRIAPAAEVEMQKTANALRMKRDPADREGGLQLSSLSAGGATPKDAPARVAPAPETPAFNDGTGGASTSTRSLGAGGGSSSDTTQAHGSDDDWTLTERSASGSETYERVTWRRSAGYDDEGQSTFAPGTGTPGYPYRPEHDGGQALVNLMMQFVVLDAGPVVPQELRNIRFGIGEAEFEEKARAAFSRARYWDSRNKVWKLGDMYFEEGGPVACLLDSPRFDGNGTHLYMSPEALLAKYNALEGTNLTAESAPAYFAGGGAAPGWGGPQAVASPAVSTGSMIGRAAILPPPPE